MRFVTAFCLLVFFLATAAKPKFCLHRMVPAELAHRARRVAIGCLQ
jgi:hypothetical protein